MQDYFKPFAGFAAVVATDFENVHEPLVVGLKFSHSTLADP